MRWTRDQYTISCEASDHNVARIAEYLRSSYWAQGVSEEIVRAAIENSLCFSLLDGRGDQIGFARVVTDYATFAYLGDVFILDEYQGSGLGTWLIECVAAHPRLQGLRRWMLATRDAHGLYKKTGFTELANPERFMERHHPYLAS